MEIWGIIVIILITVLGIMGGVLYIFEKRITKLEERIIQVFKSRTDSIPCLFEVSKDHLARHDEIFREILELRKKEFSLSNISSEIESFIELESKIHHEVNFIFQVCNKNPKFTRNGVFLYVRDVMMDKSRDISNEIKKYRRVISIYNTVLTYKNYSIIGLALPFSKKVGI